MIVYQLLALNSFLYQDIASKNPAKFNLTSSDIESRRQFISQTKDFVQVILTEILLIIINILLIDKN